jgi:hypothetical protein
MKNVLESILLDFGDFQVLQGRVQEYDLGQSIMGSHTFETIHTVCCFASVLLQACHVWKNG